MGHGYCAIGPAWGSKGEQVWASTSLAGGAPAEQPGITPASAWLQGGAWLTAAAGTLNARTVSCGGLQAALAWWNTVSPFSPYGPTIALVFVLLVAAGKAIIEDKKRHKEDRITNNSTAHVVQKDGTSLPLPYTAS